MSLKIKRKTRDQQEIPLDSTADIAFLLIVFFLAASALLEFRGIQVPLPKLNAPPMQIEKKDLLKVEVTREGAFRQDGKILSLNELQAELRQRAAINPGLVIVLRVHPDAPTDRVPQFVRRVQEENLKKISIGMEQVR